MTQASDHDATQAFLKSLPELQKGQTYRFACHPEVPCFNQCCSDLTLMLTPYDVLRLRRALGLSSRDFMQKHAVTAISPDTGMPMLRLRMLENQPGQPCPFVSRAGCTVYPDRPGACRTYPLGRATKTDGQGQVVEQFFIVQEPHCRGFEQDKHWTSEAWLADQGLEAYNRANDRYMLLLAMAKEQAAPISQRQASLAFLAAYSLDAFKDFIAQMRVFERLDVSPEDQSAILADEERRLEFATDWLALVLFGQDNGLKKAAP